jgi:hypothetical protein
MVRRTKSKGSGKFNNAGRTKLITAGGTAGLDLPDGAGALGIEGLDLPAAAIETAGQGLDPAAYIPAGAYTVLDAARREEIMVQQDLERGPDQVDSAMLDQLAAAAGAGAVSASRRSTVRVS